MSGSSSPNALLATVRRLAAGDAADPQELTGAFDIVLNGDATPSQIAALLIGLRVRGETPAELAAVVRSFRRAMVHLPAERPEELVDTCGTGGACTYTNNTATCGTSSCGAWSTCDYTGNCHPMQSRTCMAHV